MIKFITYGDDRFRLSRDRIVEEVQQLNFFDSTEIHTDLTIKKLDQFNTAMSNPDFEWVFTRSRGGGYWMWKPLIIHYELQKLKPDDILVYADAGCTVPPGSETVARLERYVENTRAHETGVQTWRGTSRAAVVKKWTKADVLDHFGVLHDKQTHQLPMRGGGRQIIRKCGQSMEIFKLWWDTALNHPNLFSDRPSEIPNLPGFKGHRHDQSIWTLIAKQYNVFTIIDTVRDPDFEYKMDPVFRTERIRE